MQRNRILLSYKDHPNYKLMDFVRNVIERMDECPYFPGLLPIVLELKTAFTEYEKAVPAKDMRNKLNLARRDTKQRILIEVLDKLAYSIMAFANNDREKLKSTGFVLNAVGKSSKPVPATPSGVEAFLTNVPTSIAVICNANRHVKIFKARVSEDNENWKWGGENTIGKVFVHDLPLGKILNVQLMALNNKGASSWSDSVQIRLPFLNEPSSKRLDE